MGVSLQGSAVYVETLVPSTRIVAHEGKEPTVGEETFIAPNASVIGDVKVGSRAAVWYGAVVRGDRAPISIGAGTSVQERAVVASASQGNQATTIGDSVVIGVGAQVAGCTVRNGSLVGVGASMEPGSTVEAGAVLAAGSVLPAGGKVPSGQLWSGNPAAYLRDLTAEEQASLLSGAADLSTLAAHHGVEVDKSIEQIESEKEHRKEQMLRGGDTIMNPNPNFFEERPGVIFHQEEPGNVTYQSVDQHTIDARTFNRFREVESELSRQLRGAKPEDGRSVDKSLKEVKKQIHHSN